LFFCLSVRYVAVVMGQGNTKSGVIGWGTSDYGQLGSVSSSSQKSRSPRLVEVLARTAQSAVSVAASGNFSLVVLDTGEVVVFGKGESCQLGLGVGEYSSPVPRLIRGSLHGKVVKSVACSDFHCAAITDSGSLFTWGRGQHGRLGHGVTEDEPAPRLVEALVGTHSISLVACGEYHTLAVNQSGAVFAFGLGLSGRLGLGAEEDKAEPCLIGGPLLGKSAISVAAGGHHSAAIVNPGVLYTWGGSSFGKLGHGSSVTCCLVPKLVAGLSHIRLVQVALGQHHSAALAVNGDVYIWGKSQGLKCEDLCSPEKVADLPPIASIVCGKKGTLFAITNSGDVYLRGPMSGDIEWMAAGFVPASDTTGEPNRQQLYVLSGKGVVSLAVGDQHCIGMAGPPQNSPLISGEGVESETTTCETLEQTVSLNRPSLYHVLESVVRSVPPPPPRPSLEGELAFMSEELKFVQIQNQKLSAKLDEFLTRIAHLERENTSLREELDASMNCLPVRAALDTSSTSVHLVHCETVSPEIPS
jgi:hypothetical protein